MNPFLAMMIANALIVLPLTGILLLMGLVVRRSALMHTLWAVLMIKLVTPPLFPIPLETWSWAEFETIPATTSPMEAIDLTEVEATFVAADESISHPEFLTGDLDVALVVPLDGHLRSQQKTTAQAAEWDPRIGRVLIALWLVGSGVYLLLILVRLTKFGRFLRHGEEAPEPTRKLASQLAQRLKLRRVPKVTLVPGRMAPLVWPSYPRPTIVLPRRLYEQLSKDAQATLLIHELAHIRRGDHMLRLLEAVVTLVYWWHPCVWIARRRLRYYEEFSCDGHVARLLPAARQAYATMLLDTIDFLTGVRTVAPPISTGISASRSLRRRITMIMSGSRGHEMGRWSRINVALVAVGLLSFGPAWGETGGADQANGGQDLAGALEVAAELIQATDAVKGANSDRDDASEIRDLADVGAETDATIEVEVEVDVHDDGRKKDGNKVIKRQVIRRSSTVRPSTEDDGTQATAKQELKYVFDVSATDKESPRSITIDFGNGRSKRIDLDKFTSVQIEKKGSRILCTASGADGKQCWISTEDGKIRKIQDVKNRVNVTYKSKSGDGEKRSVQDSNKQVQIFFLDRAGNVHTKSHHDVSGVLNLELPIADDAPKADIVLERVDDDDDDERLRRLERTLKSLQDELQQLKKKSRSDHRR